MDDSDKVTRRKASLGTSIKAVLCAFFGVKRNSDDELNPVHIVVAGLIGVLLFVAILIMVVKSVVTK